jgi:hypothetical protein
LSSCAGSLKTTACVTDAATPSGANLRRGRASVIALWLTPIALAATVLTAGGSNLAGAPATWACINDAFEEGGYQQSGVGTARGARAMQEFQEIKTRFEVIALT